ncbi:hypothetical protein [Lacinutrix salivirga]
MKKNTFILFFMLVCNSLMFAQEDLGPFNEETIFAPESYNVLTPKESWEIHKTAFIKKLEKEGVKQVEVKKRLLKYEKEKATYFANLKERHRLAAIEREKAAIRRKEAAKRRKLAEIERDKAAIRREEAAEKRKLADEWRKNYELLLSKNVALVKDTDNIEPITFEISSETTISFGVRANIYSGNVKLVMYNPDGKIEAELNVEYQPKKTSKNDKMARTSGSLDKKIAGAKVGTWQIKIIPIKAEGSVAFSVSLKKNQ